MRPHRGGRAQKYLKLKLSMEGIRGLSAYRVIVVVEKEQGP